jgi:hypothetical protein
MLTFIFEGLNINLNPEHPQKYISNSSLLMFLVETDNHIFIPDHADPQSQGRPAVDGALGKGEFIYSGIGPGTFVNFELYLIQLQLGFQRGFFKLENNRESTLLCAAFSFNF